MWTLPSTQSKICNESFSFFFLYHIVDCLVDSYASVKH
jgi:predicted alpha-1,6-mannanase (GH76 family)